MGQRNKILIIYVSRNLRRHFREERQRQRTWERENDTDDGYDDEAGELLHRLDREGEIHRLILAALPPTPAPSVGRNQPCPCGSGHKFKKCCG